jgi:hypothetical protein
MRTIRQLVIPIAAACIVAACSTTTLKDQWRDADYKATSTPRVLVIAVMSHQEQRRIFEDELVTRLVQAGAVATASYPSLSIKGPEDLDAVRRIVAQSGATLVLSVRLVSVEHETVVTGGYYGSTGFYGYHAYAQSNMSYYEPPELHDYRIYFTETRVFDMKSNKMIWAATMKTEQPDDFRKATARYADIVVEQLQDNKIVVGAN